MRAERPHGTDYEYPDLGQDGGRQGQDADGGGSRADDAAAGAAALAAEGRHEEAIAACGEAIKGGPGGAWAARAQRAASLEALGRLREAAKDCQKALKAPEGGLGGRAAVENAVRLGRLYIREGKAAKAANHLAKEAARSPSEPSILAYRGLALVLDDRHGEALAAIGRAGTEAVGADPAVLCAEARALYETGRYGEAAERCRRACEADAGCSAAWLYAGMSRDAEGMGAEARESYERVAAIRNTDDTDMAASAGTTGTAHALHRLGRHEEAAALIGPAAAAEAAAGGAAADPSRTRIMCLAGIALEKCGRAEEAEGHLRAAASSRPAGSDGLYYAGLAAYTLGRGGGEARRYDEAEGHLRRALARNKESARAAALAEAARKARLDAGEGRKKEAERMVMEKKEAERRAAAAAGRRGARGRVHGGAGGGGYPAAGLRGGGRGAARQGRKRRAMQEAARKKEERRAFESAAALEAGALSEEGRFEDALARLDRDRAHGEAGAEWLDARARALYGLGRYEEAARHFAKARPGGRSDPDARTATAAASARRARRRQYEDGRMGIANYNDSLYMIEKILEDHPGHHEALVLGGVIHAHSANIRDVDTSDKKAMVLLDRALRDDPRDAQAQYHRGRMLEKMGRRDEAGAAYDTAAACTARRAEDHFCIGRSLDALGRFGEARAHYLEGMRLDPDLAGLYDEMAGGGEGGGGEAPPPRRERSNLAVADTNVAMPCVASVCASECDLPDDMRDKAYFARRLLGPGGGGEWEGGGGPGWAGETIIVPWACRGEIINVLPGRLSELKCHSSHDGVIERVKSTLVGIPTERYARVGIGYEDSLRVFRMYWRAWLGMGDAEKKEWQDGKKANGKLAGGGPPEGAVDTKVLAIAAKIASEQSRTVTLYSCDEDFGAFRRHIARIGVRVQPA